MPVQVMRGLDVCCCAVVTEVERKNTNKFLMLWFIG